MLWIALSAASVPARAIVSGQVDDFEDGTTQGWISGAVHPSPPANIASGGPAGANDNYLRLTATGQFGPGGKLVAFNRSQWAGNYTAAGVTNITMSLRNFGANPLSLRLMLQSASAQIISTNAVSVPANSGWTTVNFPVTASSFTAQFGSVEAALTGANELRLFHNPVFGFPGPEIATEVGLDNIRAVGTATVSGTLTFEDLVAEAAAQMVTFTFRPTVGSPFDRVVAVPATGVFSLTDIPPANYTLHIKSEKHLAANVTADSSSGSVSDLSATLRAGDANNDNSVDVLDLDLLVQAFDKCLGDTGFISGADFNGDDCVDVLDLDLLVRNFDTAGDS